MQTQLQSTGEIVRRIILVLALGAFITGCGDEGNKSTDNDPDPIDYSPNVDDDVATSMAASLAADNGGVADQIVDIVSLSSGEGLRATNLVTGNGSGTGQLSYNPGNGTWQWTFTREYSGANKLYVARVERTYEWRFLKKSGQPQVAYVHNGDTAYSIVMNILSGSGWHQMPLQSQMLMTLAGHLVATGTNTDDIAVDGWWSRSALDTNRTRSAVRAIQHACSLAVADMHCQRDSADGLWRRLSGTITGQMSASIEFLEGDAYPEDTVTRGLSIALDTGVAEITVDDSTWTSDLRHGVIQLPPDPE